MGYILVSKYYTRHFYNNMTISGLNVSGKTIEDVKKQINDELKDYSLSLEGRDGLEEEIHGYSINMNVTFNNELEELLKSQKGYDWPKYLFEKKDIEIETIVGYDEELFDLNFSNLAFFDEEAIAAPQDAYVGEYDGTSYKIVPEVYGNKLRHDLVIDAVLDAISNLQQTVSLEEIGSYESPTILDDDPKLLQLVEDLNKPASTVITYEFGDDIEVLDGNLISQWLIVDDNNQVTLDEEGVKEFVDHIGSTYNTFGKTRTLETSYGQTIEVSGGDYGWWLNRAKEASEIIELINESAQVVKEPAYFQTAAHYGEDDVGDTYVEVNLTAQHLFFYKDGELVVESDFVSGNLSRGYVNPTGTFPVQYRERDATLTGEDYSSPVNYWMPFYRDIGFHDAPWRNSFGGQIYKTNGSRGCINMPHDGAEKMFEHIQRGVAVFVYELPGTETSKTSGG